MRSWTRALHSEKIPLILFRVLLEIFRKLNRDKQNAKFDPDEFQAKS